MTWCKCFGQIFWIPGRGVGQGHETGGGPGAGVGAGAVTAGGVGIVGAVVAVTGLGADQNQEAGQGL